jgi:hypothetical protein
MKSTFLILSTNLVLTIHSQNTVSPLQTVAETTPSNTPAAFDIQYASVFSAGISEVNWQGEPAYLQEGERINLPGQELYAQPAAPLLTTNPSDLEICTGSSTRLTANSSHIIYWYTTPPPIGSPVGTGTSYITPLLTTGYYTYYAIAENDGIKSNFSSMEVVMVYPSPTLAVLSSANTLCAGETATLTVSGTRYYAWDNGMISDRLIINPEKNTSYKVTGINTAGCQSIEIYNQAVQVCKVDELPEIDRWQSAGSGDPGIYPNPNYGEFNVSVNSISENTKVEVYNGLGELIYSSKISSGVTPVTLKNYPKSIYIVRVIENNKILKQDKVIRE